MRVAPARAAHRPGSGARRARAGVHAACPSRARRARSARRPSPRRVPSEPVTSRVMASTRWAWPSRGLGERRGGRSESIAVRPGHRARARDPRRHRASLRQPRRHRALVGGPRTGGRDVARGTSGDGRLGRLQQLRRVDRLWCRDLRVRCRALGPGRRLLAEADRIVGSPEASFLYRASYVMELLACRGDPGFESLWERVRRLTVGSPARGQPGRRPPGRSSCTSPSLTARRRHGVRSRGPQARRSRWGPASGPASWRSSRPGRWQTWLGPPVWLRMRSPSRGGRPDGAAWSPRGHLARAARRSARAARPASFDGTRNRWPPSVPAWREPTTRDSGRRSPWAGMPSSGPSVRPWLVGGRPRQRKPLATEMRRRVPSARLIGSPRRSGQGHSRHNSNAWRGAFVYA